MGEHTPADAVEIKVKDDEILKIDQIKIKAVLEYVPSAVFPAIIFPGIFINDFGTFIEMNDPKIFGALVAVIVGYFSKNIIATISAGLVSYWFLIFVVFN